MQESTPSSDAQRIIRLLERLLDAQLQNNLLLAQIAEAISDEDEDPDTPVQPRTYMDGTPM